MALALGSVAPATFSESFERSFSESFERCFGRVYAYVSRRTEDRESLERIVSVVLVANLHLLIERRDEVRESRRLKTSADRRIALDFAAKLQRRALEERSDETVPRTSAASRGTGR